MRRLSLFFLFLAFVTGASAQGTSTTFLDAQPYTEEYARNLSELLKSFESLPEIEVAVDTIDLWLKWATVENYTFGKNRGSMSMITDLGALHPFFRDKAIQLIAACREKGIELAIVETFRTVAKQDEYKSMGKKYTRSGGGHSKHQYGLAIDVVPVMGDSAMWHNELLWKKIGMAGEKIGMRWGGRWRHPYDPGHFEWTAGLNSYQLSQGVYPKMPAPQEYPCVEEDLVRLQKYWKAWETEQSSVAKAVITPKK